MVPPRLRGALAVLTTAGLVAAQAVGAFAATAGIDWTQNGFPTVVASTGINPSASVTTTLAAGGVRVTIPAGTFSAPVEFQLLEGSPARYAGEVPAGAVPVLAFGFRVLDNGQLVSQFQKPIMVSYTNTAIDAQSQYYNVLPDGKVALNPVRPTISGDTLTHPILGDPVAWVVTAPTSGGTDWTTRGFTQVVASATVTPTAPAKLTDGDMVVTVPAGAFSQTVTFEVLQQPVAQLQTKAPTGDTVLTDVAFRALAGTTVIAKYNKPILFAYTNTAITPATQYDNITPTGTFAPNPIAPKVSGTTLTHPIAGSPVAWAVVNGAPLAPATAGGAGPTSSGTLPKTGGSPWLPASGALLLTFGLWTLGRRRGTATQSR